MRCRSRWTDGKAQLRGTRSGEERTISGQRWAGAGPQAAGGMQTRHEGLSAGSGGLWAGGSLRRRSNLRHGSKEPPQLHSVEVQCRNGLLHLVQRQALQVFHAENTSPPQPG